MKFWWGLLLCLSLTRPAMADTESNVLAARARTALADKNADLPSHGDLLAQYADSLRSLDVVLAAKCLEVSGIAAFRTNRLDSALSRWQRGVDWSRQADQIRAESSLLNALAIGHTARGDTEAALPVYERCLEIREALADTVGLSRTWGNLTQAYVNIGRTAEALAAASEQDKWLARTNNPEGQVGNSIRRAQILTAMGRFEEALLQSRGVFTLAGEWGDMNAQGLAGMALGNTLLDLGRSAEALPILSVAVGQLRETGDDFSATFVEQSIVQCLLRLGRADEALQKVRALIPEVEAGGQIPLLTVLRRYEGHALFELGQIAESERALTEALTLFEARREALADDGSRAGIFLASGEIYASLARCQLATGRTDEAFATVERGRGALFRDNVDADIAGITFLQSALRQSQSALILFNDPALDPLVAFVLDGDSLRVVDLGPVGPIAEDARAALRLLAAGESLATCQPALVRLEKLVAGPILAAVGPNVKRFAVVPPSFLAGFPLGILRDADGRNWNEYRPLSYLPNASALVVLTGREAPEEGVLAMADPAVPLVKVGRLPLSVPRAQAGVPLPEARAEIAMVTSQKNQRRVGDAASGQALREGMASPLAVLHLATHAVVDPIDGGRSAIVLVGDGGPEVVTAHEISARNFRGDLVVLSGCSTFGEHRVLGEGWFGLPRSFLTAGARSVVSTLWDVDDRGARRFMTIFYGALRQGAARDDALLQARNECRLAGMPPREWAAFVLTGVAVEGVPLLAAEKGLSTRLPWLAVLMLVGGLGVYWWLRRQDGSDVGLE